MKAATSKWLRYIRSAVTYNLNHLCCPNFFLFPFSVREKSLYLSIKHRGKFLFLLSGLEGRPVQAIPSHNLSE